ncbi:MAG: hypothetical protein HY247_06215 [archaeon]|nr:MAG: hypothetical protein HY247_06215 [archaeon]
MSFGAVEADSFLGPLRGKATTLLVEDRGSNLALAAAILAAASYTSRGCSVLDLDALYASNADRVTGGLSPRAARATRLLVPNPGARVERAFATLCSAESDVLVVDSLNSLYHLLSAGEAGSRTRRIGFAAEALSFAARTGGAVSLTTMYRREGPPRAGGGRPISHLVEVVASVSVRGGNLELTCEKGDAWPGRKLTVSIP